MAEKRINTRIIHKHETEANWRLSSLVPMQGELIVYDIDENYNYERIKIGDGVRNVNSLPFVDDVLRTELLEQINDVDDKVDTVSGLVGDTAVSDQISAAINNYSTDWNADDGVAGHILNRTHYAKEIENVWIEETPMEFTSSNYYGVEFQGKTIVVGKTYKTVFDGETYYCTAKTIKAGGTAYVVFGNLVDFNGDDTGEPFCVLHIPVFGVTAVTLAPMPNSGELSVTVSIAEVEEDVHKIDPKYLPEGVGYEKYDTKMIVQDLRFWPMEGETDVNADWINFEIIDGAHSVRVVFDSVTYECPVRYNEDYFVFGNWNNSDPEYPFFAMGLRESNRATVGGTDGGEHVISIYGIYERVHKIAPKYLPDGIGYVEMATVFQGANLEADPNLPGEFLLEGFIPVAGTTYEIKWGDLVYTCTAEIVSDGGRQGTGFGDLSIVGGSDNGEPFMVIWDDPTSTSSTFVDFSGVSMTASIEIKGEQVRKIPEKYLSCSMPKCATIVLSAANWVGETNPWSQVVTVNGVTTNTKVDLQPSALQIISLQDNDIALVAENDNGVVTVYALGNKPTVDYTMQALLTEVVPV